MRDSITGIRLDSFNVYCQLCLIQSNLFQYRHAFICFCLLLRALVSIKICFGIILVRILIVRINFNCENTPSYHSCISTKFKSYSSFQQSDHHRVGEGNPIPPTFYDTERSGLCSINNNTINGKVRKFCM